MPQINPEKEKIGQIICNVLNIFPIVTEIGLTQYLKGIKAIGEDTTISKTIKYCEIRGYVVPRTMNGIRYIAKNTITPYDMASLNGFDMMAALNEIAHIDTPIMPIPAVRCNFPYDFIYAANDTVFTIMNYDMFGDQKIISHNLMKPEAYMGISSEVSQTTVITMSDGYINDQLEDASFRGNVILAKIERKPTGINRYLTLLRDEND